MKKWKQLALGILFPVWAFSLFMQSGDPAALWLASPAVWFLGIWYYKHSRDQKIVAQARMENELAIRPSTPTSTTSDSSYTSLFVPDPLKD